MKVKSKLLTLSLLAVALVIFSCNKEDNQSENRFSYDGKTYPLIAAYGAYDRDTDQEPPVYYNEVVLIGPGIKAAQYDFTGSGNVISFDMGFASQTIEPGTYNFISVEGNANVGDLTGGLVGLNMDLESENPSGDIYFFTTGKVVVTKSGDIYTFDVDVTAGGKPLKAHFRGLLPTLERRPEE